MNPLYDYVFEIANRMYPTWDTDINDEQYQTDSFRGWDFVHQLEDERLEFSITKERYLENAPIIRSLRAMGLDTEKFWMAMLFVYDVVRERTEMYSRFRPRYSRSFGLSPDTCKKIPMPKCVHGKGASTA